MKFKIIYGKKIGGLTFNFIPLNTLDKKFNFNNEDFHNSITITETAYGFFEKCVIKHADDYREYSHYGIVYVEVNEWEKIIHSMQKLISKWKDIKNLENFKKDIYYYENEDDLTSDNLDNIIKNVISMFNEFIDWVKIALLNYKYIAIFGI